MTTEQEVFDQFKFKLGARVVHKASGEAGIVVGRLLYEAQTGNTGHVYEVSTGQRYSRRFEIELTDQAEQ